VSEFVLPTPAAIVERFARDFTLIAHHSLVTLVETLAGFIIAAVAGIATAFAVFYSRVFERAFYPLLVAMQTVPKVALEIVARHGNYVLGVSILHDEGLQARGDNLEPRMLLVPVDRIRTLDPNLRKV
jgi:hypothetical protein